MAKEASAADLIKAAIEAHDLGEEGHVLASRVVEGPTELQPIPFLVPKADGTVETLRVSLAKGEKAVVLDTAGGQTIVWKPGDPPAEIPASHHPGAKPRRPKRAGA